MSSKLLKVLYDELPLLIYDIHHELARCVHHQGIFIPSKCILSMMFLSGQVSKLMRLESFVSLYIITSQLHKSAEQDVE